MKVSRRPENSSILTVMSQRERVQGADASFGAAGGFDGGATTNLVLLLVVVVVVEEGLASQATPRIPPLTHSIPSPGLCSLWSGVAGGERPPISQLPFQHTEQANVLSAAAGSYSETYPRHNQSLRALVWLFL
mmetsp:Transcript_36781/g.75174  ORF Transcript_36781/g.75174 Transcript_36781/m.75174 type:complete len:133 (+) Transcript_36781:109-507(+)